MPDRTPPAARLSFHVLHWLPEYWAFLLKTSCLKGSWDILRYFDVAWKSCFVSWHLKCTVHTLQMLLTRQDGVIADTDWWRGNLDKTFTKLYTIVFWEREKQTLWTYLSFYFLYMSILGQGCYSASCSTFWVSTLAINLGVWPMGITGQLEIHEGEE